MNPTQNITLSPVISALQKALGKDKVLIDHAVKERYVHIWKMDQPLAARAVVLPKNTEDVSTILKICHAHDQPVVMHGGLTNMVGSTETEGDEVVISMEKMNHIEEIDTKSRTITVQAGVILEEVQNKAKENDLMFPVNFGAKGSAQIGGVISTNAGGMRVFRFGMTRNMVMGLEVVLADGTIISSMKKIIKDNSAYDLKQMFIGSEGTLGVVTRAVLKLMEAPRSRNCAIVAFDEYDKVVDFLRYMDKGLAGTLSCFELFWKDAFMAQTSPPSSVKSPLPYDYDHYVLLESLGGDQEQDFNKLQSLLEVALEKEMILDAALTQSQSDLDWFFKIREDVHVMKTLSNHDQHFDISLPIAHIGPCVNQMIIDLRQIPQVETTFAFGHMADGNIHFIIGKSEETPELIKQINKVVYGPLKAIGGSVSAEHGIGTHKKDYLSLCRTPEEIQLMRLWKQAMDPKGILNRGKVLG